MYLAVWMAIVVEEKVKVSIRVSIMQFETCMKRQTAVQDKNNLNNRKEFIFYIR